jgi:hypothetical protein
VYEKGRNLLKQPVEENRRKMIRSAWPFSLDSPGEMSSSDEKFLFPKILLLDNEVAYARVIYAVCARLS